MAVAILSEQPQNSGRGRDDSKVLDRLWGLGKGQGSGLLYYPARSVIGGEQLTVANFDFLKGGVAAKKELGFSLSVVDRSRPADLDVDIRGVSD